MIFAPAAFPSFRRSGALVFFFSSSRVSLRVLKSTLRMGLLSVLFCAEHSGAESDTNLCVLYSQSRVYPDLLVAMAITLPVDVTFAHATRGVWLKILL